MEFRTQYDRLRVQTQPGDRYKRKLELVSGDRGSVELVETGKDDLYEEIQAYADECDIHYILNRFKNGETDVLNQRVAQYVDTSMFPKTFAEFLNVYLRAEQEFNAFDKDTRAKFNNNFREYLATAGSDEWLEKLGFVREQYEAAADPVGFAGGSAAESAAGETGAPGAAIASQAPAEAASV